MIKTLIKLEIEGNCLYMIRAVYNELPGVTDNAETSQKSTGEESAASVK